MVYLMIFEENNENVITVTNAPQSFVYFLLDGNEVVYVGQTSAGLGRPFQHMHDKVFDCVKIIPCKKCELDKMESAYITKYKPKYNRIINAALYVRLLTARNKLRDRGCIGYTIPHLKRDAKQLNITFELFNGKQYIQINDIDRLFSFVKAANK